MTHIYTYFVVAASVVFLTTFAVLWVKNKKPNIIGLLLILGAFFSFVIGSRVAHYFININLYKTGTFTLTMFELKGFSLYGGITLSAIYIILFAKITKLKFWELSDIICISFALGFIPMRLGCYYNGCCFGIPFDGFWSKTYGFMSFSHLVQYERYKNILPLSVHPTQIYEIIIVVISLLYGLWQLRKTKKHGMLSLNFALLFTVGRFLNLFLREPLPSSEYHESMSFYYMILIIIIWLTLHKHKKSQNENLNL